MKPLLFIYRILFSPFALLYGGIVWCRNAFYDFKIFNSVEYDVPLIGVGNLSMGGTGKTPHIEYLIRLLIAELKIATLSRGYKRSTAGFALADENSTAATIGDEPFQYHFKFPDVAVSVAENRVFGIAELLAAKQDTDVVLLDDVFQHRPIKPGLQILITDYNDPFYSDFVIPIGRLREPRMGASRANFIVVSKCPSSISDAEKNKVIQKIKKYSSAEIFFSFIQYTSPYAVFENEKETQLTKNLILLTGIANPALLQKQLADEGFSVIPFTFTDHYNYQLDDLEKIKRVIAQQKKSLTDFSFITTEKDAMRLLPYKNWFEENKISLWVQPVEVKFLSNGFDEKVNRFIHSFRTRN